MLTTQLKIQSSEDEIWLRNDHAIDDFLVLTEGVFVFFETALDKMAINQLVKPLFWLLLFPIRFFLVVLAIPIYFIMAVFFRFYFLFQIQKIVSIRLKIEKRISSKSVSLDRWKEEHSITKKLLNDLHPRLKKLEGEKIMKPSLDGLIQEIKKIELIERVAAYPERNEIVLTFDELRELSELTDLSF